MFAQYFSKKSYTAILATEPVGIVNVTFEPDCRNNWHIHHGAGELVLPCGYRCSGRRNQL